MIVPVDSTDQLQQVRELFHEYGVMLQQRHGAGCLKDYEQEIAGLPGDYAPPGGCLLLALVDGQVAGCAGLRRIALDAGEMKRLYVRPAYRGQKIGRELAQAVVVLARQRGYRRVCLDTMPAMTEARRLYETMGFVVIPAYGAHHPEGAVCMELRIG